MDKVHKAGRCLINVLNRNIDRERSTHAFRIPKRVQGRREFTNNIEINPIQVLSRPRFQHVCQSAVRHCNLITVTDSKPKQHQDHCAPKLALINAQSVCNKTERIYDYIVKQSVDILAISETWIRPELHYINDLVTPSGYVSHSSCRANGRGGGVMLVLKAAFKASPQKAIQVKSFELCTVCIPTKPIQTCLIVLYRPPSGNQQQFLDEFTDLLEECHTKACRLMIMGYFNVHVDDANDNFTSRFNEICQLFSLKQHVEQPTHQSGHIIDLILTRECDNVVSSVKTTSLFTDHFAIECTLSLPKKEFLARTVQFRPMHKLKMDTFRNDIQNKCAQLLSDKDNNIDDLVKNFNQSLRDTLDAHVPITTKKTQIRPVNPWYDNDIHIQRQLKRKHERRWKNTNSPENLNRFLQQRDSFNSLLDQKKSEYYHNLITDNQGNQKQLFQIFNKLCRKPTQTEMPDCESSEKLADEFSQFFHDKIAKIVENFTDSDYQVHNILAPSTKFMQFQPVSEETVRKCIMDSPSKSCMLDPIPTHLLKLCISEIVPIVTHIINESLRLGKVPTAFKQAIVTPLQKNKSCGTDFSNYRPVSNLPFLSKVLERIVLQQVISHCNTNHLTDPLQSAYRVGHSTETALIKVFDDLLTTMDNKMVSILTLLDLSAAFDTVDHQILLTRFDNLFGIQSDAKNWFQSYLDNRYQCVKIQNATSVPRQLTTGVPQGSGIGPWAYTSYTREIGIVIRLFSVLYHLFADDSQLQKSMTVDTARSQLCAKSSVESCLREIAEWTNASKLKLNSNKTEAILIGTPQQLNKVVFNSIEACGNEIQTKASVKNLGVIIDSDLKMKSQINHVTRICYANLHMLRKFKHHLSSSAMHSLVQAFVISRIDYANALYYGIPDCHMKKLQRVQNMAARLLHNLKLTDHITPALITLHWLPVKQRCVYKIAIITFKCLQDTGPSYLRDLLVERKHSRALRSLHQLALETPRSNLKYAGDRSFRVAAPRIWNNLPEHIKAVSNINTFKSKLKYYLFTQAYEQFL